MWSHSLKCELTSPQCGSLSPTSSTPQEYPTASLSFSVECLTSGVSHIACPGLTPVFHPLSVQTSSSHLSQGHHHLVTQARSLALTLDSSLSLGPHSISKYCHLYLEKISQIRSHLLTSTTTIRVTMLPALHNALVSYMVLSASACTPHSLTPLPQPESGARGHQTYIQQNFRPTLFPLYQCFPTSALLIFGAR